jgi:hypothetical protein
MVHISEVHTALAHRELAAGVVPPAVSRLRANLAAAACLQSEPTYIRHMVGRWLERRLMPKIRQELEAGRLDGAIEELRSAIAVLKSRSTRDLLRAEAAIFQPKALWREHSLARQELGAWYDPFDVTGFAAAAAVRGLGRTIESLDDAEPPASRAAVGWPWNRDVFYQGAVGETYWRNERMSEAQNSLRALALQSFSARQEALRTGRYPVAGEEVGDATPLIGERVRVEAGADGSLVLSLPRSAARWKQLQPMFQSRPHFDWTWTLPPVATPTPSVEIP